MVFLKAQELGRFCALPQGKECDALSKAVGKRYSDFL